MKVFHSLLLHFIQINLITSIHFIAAAAAVKVCHSLLLHFTSSLYYHFTSSLHFNSLPPLL